MHAAIEHEEYVQPLWCMQPIALAHINFPRPVISNVRRLRFIFVFRLSVARLPHVRSLS